MSQLNIVVLDDLLRPEHLIDVYESFIWTERYSGWGDFELVVRSNRRLRRILEAGVHLHIARSYRVMTIETIEDGVDDDGAPTLTVTGRSLEAILEDRPGFSSVASLLDNEKWVLTGLPADIARTMFTHICVNGAISPHDTIPLYQSGSFLPTTGAIAEPAESTTLSFEPASLYKHIKHVCDVYNLGFRIVRTNSLGDPRLQFHIYTGRDKTSAQTVRAPVIFSPALDNLSDTKELTSFANYKNVALVLSKQGTAWVYPDNVDPDVAGFERRVLVVKVDNIDDVLPEDVPATLQQRGKEALADHRIVLGFDGEIPQAQGLYVYGNDYDLGDLVEKRNVDGFSAYMRVTEQIFVSDRVGIRSYPTLTIDTIITPGTWLAQPVGLVWDNAQGYWADA